MTTTELRSSVLLIQSTVTGTTATITQTRGFRVLFCDTSSNAITVDLPSAVGNLARISIKKMDAKNTVTVDCAGAEYIDGAGDATLTDQYESITLVSDGTNWGIV